MSLIEYCDLEQRSPEWYEARCGIVTASVVGQLLTPKTAKTADNDYSRALTALLVAERVTGYVEPTYPNADMWRGIEAEPHARDKYSEVHAEARECGFMVREEPMPWDPKELARPVDEDTPTWRLGYSPDGLVGDDGLIEIKAPRQKTHLLTILSGGVPAGHLAQIQAGLLVSGRAWCDFISWCGGMPMYVKRVLPDPQWHEAIVSAIEAFEESAAQMVADYRTATEGLPATERLADLEMVI